MCQIIKGIEQGGQAGSADTSLCGHCTSLKRTRLANGDEINSIIEGTKWVQADTSNEFNRINRNGPLSVDQIKAIDQIGQLARELTKVAEYSSGNDKKVQLKIGNDIGMDCLEIKTGEVFLLHVVKQPQTIP